MILCAYFTQGLHSETMAWSQLSNQGNIPSVFPSVTFTYVLYNWMSKRLLWHLGYSDKSIFPLEWKIGFNSWSVLYVSWFLNLSCRICLQSTVNVCNLLSCKLSIWFFIMLRKLHLSQMDVNYCFYYGWEENCCYDAKNF